VDGRGKFQTSDRVSRAVTGRARYAPRHAPLAGEGAGSLCWRRSFHCHWFWRNADGRRTPAHSRQFAGLDGDSFDDRFPKPQFRDRFPTRAKASNSASRPTRRPNERRKPNRSVPGRVAGADVPYQRPQREDQTTLVS